MYLLILLMTYVSAIYEYNLSVRPDYDRDVARKKANAIFYKFNNQHVVVKDTLGFATGKLKNDETDKVDPTFPQPNTVFGASKDWCEEDNKCKNDKLHATTLFYKDAEGNKIPFYLRPKGKFSVIDGEVQLEDESVDVDDNGNWYQKLMLLESQSLYDGSEMASKLLCINKQLHEADIVSCTSELTPEGHLSGTCCGGEEGRRILVSYKKIDPRWLNRLYNKINLDFIRALEPYQYYNNLGIIQWDEDKDRWIFTGKTSMYASYYNALQEWKEIQAEKTSSDSMYVEEEFPRFMKKVSTWELPEIFDVDFFVNIYDEEICKDIGCIFRINEL